MFTKIKSDIHFNDFYDYAKSHKYAGVSILMLSLTVLFYFMFPSYTSPQDLMIPNEKKTSIFPVGEILNGSVFRQSLPNMRIHGGIQIKLATYQRKNHGIVKLYIKDEKTRKIVYSRDIKMESVKDNTWYNFGGESLPLTTSLALYIEGTKDCVPGNAITCWAGKSKELCYEINGKKQAGTFLMMPRTSRRIWNSPILFICISFALITLLCLLQSDDTILYFIKSHAITFSIVLVFFLIREGFLWGITARADDLRDVFYLSVEMGLLTAVLTILPRKIRFFLIPLIFFHIVQILHLFFCGCFTLTETLLNIGFAKNLSSVSHKATFMLILLSTLWIPDFCSNLLSGISKRKKLLLIFSCVLVCLLSIKYFPAWKLIKTAYHTITKNSASKEDLVHFDQYFVHSRIKNCSDVKNYFSSVPKNVILIFMEGFSKEVMSEKLTPNLCKIEKNSLSFDHYFNHTAATLRAVRGQMISGFQYAGGFQVINAFKLIPYAKIISLPKIFNEKGYQTVFLSPHPKDERLLQRIIEASAFQNSLNPKRKPYSDKEIFQILFDTAEKQHQKGTPFFLACYSLGTHHGYDSPDKKYGDGKNSYLNKFFNLDCWIGEFFRKFKESKLAEDTLLIITSDHATFPVKDYTDTFHSKQRYFTGEIPLFFYMKGVVVQKSDANWRNSLALAPTICDIFRIENQRNSFLGNSLFTKQPAQLERYYGTSVLELECKNGVFYPVTDEVSIKLAELFMRIGE